MFSSNVIFSKFIYFSHILRQLNHLWNLWKVSCYDTGFPVAQHWGDFRGRSLDMLASCKRCCACRLSSLNIQPLWGEGVVTRTLPNLSAFYCDFLISKLLSLESTFFCETNSDNLLECLFLLSKDWSSQSKPV